MFILEVSGVSGNAPATPRPQAPITNWNQFENALHAATGSRSLTGPFPFSISTPPTNSNFEQIDTFRLLQAGVCNRAMSNPQFRSSLTREQGTQIQSAIHQGSEAFDRMFNRLFRSEIRQVINPPRP